MTPKRKNVRDETKRNEIPASKTKQTPGKEGHPNDGGSQRCLTGSTILPVSARSSYCSQTSRGSGAVHAASVYFRAVTGRQGGGTGGEVSYTVSTFAAPTEFSRYIASRECGQEPFIITN